MSDDVLDSGRAGERVIRGSAARTAGYVAGILVGLASTPLLVSHLGPVDFGRYVAVSTILFIATGLTEAGLTGIGTREYAQRDAAGGRRLLRDLLGLRLVLTAVSLAGALLFGLLAGYPSVLLLGIAIGGAGLLAANLAGVYAVALTVWLRLGALAGLDLLRQVVTAVAVVVLVLVDASLLAFFFAVVAGQVAGFVATGLLVRRRVPARPAYDRPEWRALLTEALPYAAAIAMSVLYFRVALVLMSVVATDTELGYYSLAFRIIEIASGVPLLLVGSAFPVLSRAARDDADRLRHAVSRLGEVALILGVWIAIVAGLGAPFAVEVISGGDERFAPSVPVLTVLGVAMIGTFLVATWGHALLSLRGQTALMKANAGAFVLGAVLALVLIEAAGAIGAAIATTVVELGLAGAYAVLLARARGDLRPSLRIAGPVALAGSAAVAVPLVLSTPSVVSVALGSLLYLGVLAALRAVPPEVGHALRLRRAAHV